ncbi:NeuD/PglB/VioB family sugar acetyltransferase [Magnetospirillum gryphiswaldense]|uniref:Hexapeptide transferase family protein n=1 Tax=Magnetospirillum gryphiswaldense TaxID=55518 RepID=A4U182_9PROT|nr:NeuD/PglB/VioB family sugar acetyltransferase [Magnetospirillum gryphiswaldense]AVM75580.1 Putative acetyltransferase EpsM [Magnetospirillum gryphiswaldense MSR-1]AVM79483.1 Putative acetyltransferase EpsM [Magnetospirillum gryphiswaldense]CAM76639.1 hexapeptide transferase family protein [Magnetospirillum gryphiswaldense MSR-1]
MSRPFIILGAGGHARSVVGSLLRAGLPVLGLSDSEPARQGGRVLGFPVLGDDDTVLNHQPAEIYLALGIGHVGQAAPRRALMERFMALGYEFPPVVDPTAVLGHEAALGAGSQILASATVQAGCVLGVGAIVNTGAVVDHDCRIGDHAHIATGAILAGAVDVGSASLIGCGAVLRQCICVGIGAVVGAGAVVVADVANGAWVVGTPARPMRTKDRESVA